MFNKNTDRRASERITEIAFVWAIYYISLLRGASVLYACQSSLGVVFSVLEGI